MTTPNGKCQICKHVERTRAELLVAGGASFRAVAQKFGLNSEALGRHWKLHVSDERRAALVMGPVTQQALASRLSEESDSVLDHLKAARAAIYQMLDAAVTAGDSNSVAQLVGRLHENCRAVGKLTGELASSALIQNNTQNIFMTPDFGRLQAALLTALAPYHEAKTAVIRALRSIEGDGAPLRPTLPPVRIFDSEAHV